MFNNEKYYKRVFAKAQEYKGITFRSTMERDFAMFLDGQVVKYKGKTYWHKPIKWEYESKEFVLLPQKEWVDRTERDETVKTIIRNKKHTLQRVIYTPDFYLTDYDLFIETKGFQFYDESFRLRLRIFKHYYPDEAIAIIQHHEDFLDIDKIINNSLIQKQKEENR